MASFYTLLTIGQTGAGKSELGNAYLRDPSAFVANASPDAVTFLTSSQQREIDGVTRCCIDTQGINDTQGVDTEHVQQMVQFLREWKKGVNAVAIIINGQAPRLDAGTQKLIKIINTFFNNPEFWDHTCLVFTKNYKGYPLDRNILENEYRRKVQDIIVQCTGKSLRKPQLPVYLVDSKAYNNPEDISTHNDLAALHAFIVGLPPLSTQHVVAPDIRFMRIEPETRTNQLVNTRIESNGTNGRVKTLTYEDQRREKRTAYDGVTVTYSDWVATKRWDVKQEEKTIIEKRSGVVVNEQKNEVFRTEEGSRVFMGILGPRNKYEVHDHWNVTRTCNDQQRQIVTNFDGTTSYGDWVVTRTYKEKEKE